MLSDNKIDAFLLGNIQGKKFTDIVEIPFGWSFHVVGKISQSYLRKTCRGKKKKIVSVSCKESLYLKILVVPKASCAISKYLGEGCHLKINPRIIWIVQEKMEC